MKLYSNDFENNKMLDKKFTCDAEDFSPHLKWEEVPEKTKSFAISCLNSDTEYGTLAHWYVYNIPVDVVEIPQAGPIPGIEIENDFSTLGYEGPCPENGIHRYIFTVYALLDEIQELLTPLTFRKVILKNTIDSAELVGFYERKFDLRNLIKKSCH
ncbi:MAG: YbhB/YbcL family Raf kinase inhibitor-like protein [Promethearchaeota archaeon]